MFGLFKGKKVAQIEDEDVVVEVADYNDVTKIAEYFKNETGVTFENQTGILKNKVMTFCKLREIYSFTTLLSLVNSDADVKQELVDYLTTNETFFYRELKQIEELVALVKTSDSSVTILCAPCATGEEPYSIAIALLEAGIGSEKFSIVGIDVNADALKKAKEAIYRQRNVRNLSAKIIRDYFNHENGLYSLKNTIKSSVSFKLANLFDDSFKSLGKFDFIFSRNMLIYFDKETKLKAKNILESMRKNDKQNIFFGHADLF